VIIGRELSRDPDIIIAAQPTRGIDIGAIEYIHNLLLKMRDQNKGILLISAELDEIMSLSDRILVIYEGEIIAEGTNFTEEELGLLMAGRRS
jgi:simple sugar transport system ATP-binding protein